MQEITGRVKMFDGRWLTVSISINVVDSCVIRSIASARDRVKHPRLPASYELSSSWNFTTRQFRLRDIFREYEFDEPLCEILRDASNFLALPKDALLRKGRKPLEVREVNFWSVM